MLKERDVARFIVAPDGYGKTCLAFEYAETIFAWQHTFWINAKSPCFVRDLDAGDLAMMCLQADEEAALVVFDDLPPLDSHRMETFSHEVDLLLASDCEVVVTCVPMCDMVGFLQLDRIRIDARDLLLDDVELDAARDVGERIRRPAAQTGESGRIPALVWAKDERASYEFARSALGEEMPSDLLFAVACVLVLQSGTFSDLLCLGSFDRGMLAEMLSDYPHLGFDSSLDAFEAPFLDLRALAGPLKKRLPELAARSSCDSPDQLVQQWADALIEAGRAGRACDVIREVCSRRARPAWLVARARKLVGQACFYPTLRLVGDQELGKGSARMRLAALEAVCRMMLGDEEGALKCAKRCSFDEAAPVDARICGLLVVARLDAGPLATKAVEALSAAASAQAGDAAGWRLLAKAWLTGMEGPLELARFWSECLDARKGEDELCICASWLFGLLEKGQESVMANPEVRRCMRYIHDLLRVDRESEPGFFAVSAGLSLEEAHNRGVRWEGGMLEASVLIQLRKAEMNVLAQRRLFDADTVAAQVRQNDWARTHPMALFAQSEAAMAPQLKQSVPILTVRLFGHFEATIGDDPVDSKQLGKRNARTLLALLAVNQGRELSRDSIERAMWPLSSEEVAHKNFYSVWSCLRKALSLSDGTCPYLVRHQYGCCLESRYVHSDAERLSEICRELLFGVPNIDRWSALFAEIDRDFSSDLLPAERKNRLIVQARNEYRTRLVDALVAATSSVIDSDNPQWGVWFARAALKHDETREDAYVALMRAQISGNQRTAAMMTFLKCRRVLSEQLGIDPSPEATLLYESLLDAE